MRVVFLGSPPFATPTLARVLESKHEVAGLVTAPARPAGRGRGRDAPSPLVSLAEESGLTILRPENPHAEEVLSRLRELGADLFLIASYGVILRPQLLELPPRGCLNVHASLLPRFRGASPIQGAILEGDEETGVSVQRVVQALDAGDVLLERRLRIAPDDTAGTLLTALAELGGEAAVAALDLLEQGEAEFTPQDESHVTYAPKLKKEQGRIDWTRPAESIERLVRAMQPWPVATTTLPGGAGLQVLRAVVVPGDGEPGTILEARSRFVVATGDAGLELLEVKANGRAAMPADAFLRGARIDAGDRLGA